MTLTFDGEDLYDSETGQLISNPKPHTKQRPLLYVSGPMYSEGDLIINVRRAILAAERAYALGWAPIIPQLDFLVPLVMGTCTRKRFMDVDLAQVAGCHAVLLLPYSVEKVGEQISGTAEELEFAERVNRPVFTEETLPTVTSKES